MAGNGAEMAAGRGTQSRGWPAVRMNWPLVLHIDEKISQKWVCKGLSNYPPYPKAVPPREAVPLSVVDNSAFSPNCLTILLTPVYASYYYGGQKNRSEASDGVEPISLVF